MGRSGRGPTCSTAAEQQWKRDRDELEAAREDAEREAKAFAVLAPHVSVAVLEGIAERLARAANRLKSAAAWAQESAAEARRTQ